MIIFKDIWHIHILKNGYRFAGAKVDANDFETTESLRKEMINKYSNKIIDCFKSVKRFEKEGKICGYDLLLK